MNPEENNREPKLWQGTLAITVAGVFIYWAVFPENDPIRDAPMWVTVTLIAIAPYYLAWSYLRPRNGSYSPAEVATILTLWLFWSCALAYAFISAP